jgi:hypothetical protein
VQGEGGVDRVAVVHIPAPAGSMGPRR